MPTDYDDFKDAKVMIKDKEGNLTPFNINTEEIDTRPEEELLLTLEFFKME